MMTTTAPSHLDLNTIHILCLGLAFTTALSYVLHRLHQDYKFFLSLGPGGTPQTLLGFLKIKLLGLFEIRDPISLRPIPPHLASLPGTLQEQVSLPARPGTRPSTAGIAPHRQTDQIPPRQIYSYLVSCLEQFPIRRPNAAVLRLSCFEHNSQGLFCILPKRRTCRGEICHAHPSDASLHLTLHPADANLVLEKGWGQRHPLARGGWFEKFVPAGFVIVYAPRSVEEVRTVVEIVRASAWWVAGEHIVAARELDDLCRAAWTALKA